jgi:predicted ATP-dependent endonuclease of OLD family
VGLKSIRVRNLLSFEDITIYEFPDLTCIIGQNNTGKSNLLYLINFFYTKLEGKQSISPNLYSNYNSHGSISITYDLKRLKKVVSGSSSNSYLNHIYNTLFRPPSGFIFINFIRTSLSYRDTFELTLTVNKDESVSWSTKNQDIKDIINRIFPFFHIDARQIDLYDWGKLWGLVSQLKFLNARNLKKEELVDFIDSKVSASNSSYKDYVKKIDSITKTNEYSYQELVLNYVKVGLDGHTFNIEGEELKTQSDGTNSHKYIELTINLLIALTRREFITPTLFVDEPELGLHPKRNEDLIQQIYDIRHSFKKSKKEYEVGKYKTPYPKIIFSTHSPNIVKSIIRLFPNKGEHQVLHFAKQPKQPSSIRCMTTMYSDPRFLNVFSDNEARLFFSHFILFVEGATEVELFGNLELLRKFKILRKVDVYPANDVTLNTIKPSFSNLAIPYLVLVDADMLLGVAFNNQEATFSLLAKKIDFSVIKKKYQKTFPNAYKFRKLKDIENILSIDKKVELLDSSKSGFTQFKYDEYINILNNKYLLDRNFLSAITTIEGALINNNSISIFIKWMEYELLENSKLGCKGDISKLILLAKRRIKKGNSLIKVFKTLHSEHPLTKELDRLESIFIRKLRRKLIYELRSTISSMSLNEAELLIALRLVFGGKTDSLVSCDNKNYQYLSHDFKKSVTYLSDCAKDLLPGGTEKTGGWVTKFLSFSIKYMENSPHDFNLEFKRAFPEIFAIIQKVSVSIE